LAGGAATTGLIGAGWLKADDPKSSHIDADEEADNEAVGFDTTRGVAPESRGGLASNKPPPPPDPGGGSRSPPVDGFFSALGRDYENAEYIMTLTLRPNT
jgi:hypothetical protein